ncbi:MAG: ABC transporter ATP-binding protein [Thermoproteota archaeon]|nr:MAG: ABC transporter ATP-binding protein [Candidatus Korarchaeota archaeon]
MNAVVVEKVTKKYGDVTALDDVSLSVREGEIFGLLGPNGAGKTTLMEIIVGLRRPDSGKVILLGTDVTKKSNEIGHIIGFNPQETMLYDNLTVLENLEFIASLYSFSREKFEERLRILSEMFELSNFLKRRTGKLSGGQKRRASLAASLLHDPPVVVLDEPTVGLDPDARREFWKFIEDMKKEGKTILLSTHYMEEADELCDRVAIMDLGKIIIIGSPDELKRLHGGSAKIAIHVKMRYLELAEKVLSDYAPTKVLEWLEIRTEKPEELVPDLIAKLQSAGIDPESVEIRSPTLEDVFLNLTGRRLMEAIR